MRALEITGERFGRLTAMERAASVGRRSMWLFRCDCGAQVVRKLETVRAGLTASCGCLRREVTAGRSRTHGHSVGRSRSKTLRAWDHAKGRCFNPSDAKFANYGGRGISMARAWAEDFSAFLRDMGECPPGHSLDRIDVDGDYAPGNCRWADSRTQSRNRTDNVHVEHHGKRVVLKDYAALRGVGYKALHSRMRRLGESASDAAEALNRARKALLESKKKAGSE